MGVLGGLLGRYSRGSLWRSKGVLVGGVLGRRLMGKGGPKGGKSF